MLGLTCTLPAIYYALVGMGLTYKKRHCGPAASDTDTDGYLAWEEFAGDTEPTQSVSHFPPAANFMGTAMAQVEIAQTSTSRQYTIFWAADLLENPQIWTPGGLNVAGTGSNLLLQITNIAPVRFY